MFETFNRDQLETVKIALTDRITYLNTMVEQMHEEIGTLETSVEKVDEVIESIDAGNDVKTAEEKPDANQ